MANFTLKVNGTTHQVEVEDDTPLLWVLRDQLNLVGTKFSCGIAQCGACTVHVNGNATFSCVTPVSSIGNSEVTTIEGLSKDGNHPVQKAWEEVDVAMWVLPSRSNHECGSFFRAKSISDFGRN